MPHFAILEAPSPLRPMSDGCRVAPSTGCSRHHRSDIPDIERPVEAVDLPGGSDSSIDVKHHLAAPLNVGDGFAEGSEPIGRCDRYSNRA